MTFYPNSTPLELGLDWMVSRDKPGMVGGEAIRERRRNGLRTRLVGLELQTDAPTPKPGAEVRTAKR